MNKERAEGKFDQLKGEIKKTWGKLTNDEIAFYEGNATKFYGVLKEKYGVGKEEAERRIKELEKAAKNRAA